MMIRHRIAFLICPALRDELEALRSGNTKQVLANGRLLDDLQEMRRQWRAALMAFRDRGKFPEISR